MPRTLTLIQNFAELGRIALAVDFAESVSDPEVLSKLKTLLSGEAGDIDRVYDVTIDDETFKGKAEQKFGLAKSQVYSFAVNSAEIQYRIINAADMAEYAESEIGWQDVVDFAAAKGKKLNCKPGNVQCGGKCQSGKMNCTKNATPQQSEEVAALVESVKVKPKAKKAKDKDAQLNQEAPVKTPPVNLKLIKDGEEQFQEWAEMARTKEISDLIQKVEAGKPPTTEAEKRLADNAQVVRLMELDIDSATFRGVQDDNGNMQAGAIIEKRPKELYVDLLATAPWNLKDDGDPRKVKGAGTKLLYELAKEAANSDSDITLDAADRARSFYEKMGFSVDKEPTIAGGDTKMRLGVEAAKAFVAKMDASLTPPPSKPKAQAPKKPATPPKASAETSTPPLSTNPKKLSFGAGGKKAQALKELKEIEAEAKKQADQSPQALANYRIIEGISRDVSTFGSKGLRTIRDENGVLQATAVILTSKDGYVVDLLATSPHNLNPSDPRYTKGAGTAAMEQIMLESIQKSNGEVSLTALPGAISFYEKIGFRLTGENDDYAPKMSISKADAEKFLKSRGVAGFAEEKSLEDLEEEALGAFAVNEETLKTITDTETEE